MCGVMFIGQLCEREPDRWLGTGGENVPHNAMYVCMLCLRVVNDFARRYEFYNRRTDF